MASARNYIRNAKPKLGVTVFSIMTCQNKEVGHLLINFYFTPSRLTGRGQQSGYGFELTFRLRRQPGEETAPRWPILLLSSLAKYVFHSGSPCGVL